jgi:HK97 family phage prohead protease
MNSQQMSRTRVVGYPVLWRTPRKVHGVDALEVVAPSVRLSSHEGLPVICVINHDESKMLASTADGLSLVRDGLGVRVSFEIPATPPGAELRAALNAQTVRGGSFRWRAEDGAVYRWSVARRPWVRTIQSAVLREVTICIGRTPAFAGTWVTGAGSRMAPYWERLAETAHTAYGKVENSNDSADVVITLRHHVGVVGQLLDLIDKKFSFGIESDIAAESRSVEAALTKNPGARTIDVRYGRSVNSVLEVARRREAVIGKPSGGERPPQSAASLAPGAAPPPSPQDHKGDP